MNGVDIMSLGIKDFTLFYTDIHMINVVLFLIFLDILLGVSVAIFVNKNFLSKSAYIGYVKKMGILVAIIVGNVIDIILSLDGVLMQGTVWFYIAYELSSIIEHLAVFGVPIPPRVINALEVIKGKGDDTK
ncbi:phage holin family protein [Streptococcus mutans]|nr:phage holin family protein [Streptococcus mutans]MCB5031923.1 phage holin family protein [Streptococcus mutans]